MKPGGENKLLLVTRRRTRLPALASLVPRHVGRELFAAGLLLEDLATLGVSTFSIAASAIPPVASTALRSQLEVEHELLRIGEIAFDPLAEGELQGGISLQLELCDVSTRLIEPLRLLFDQMAPVRDHLRTPREDSRPASRLRQCF